MKLLMYNSTKINYCLWYDYSFKNGMEEKMSKNNYKTVQTTKNERELRLTEIFKANLIAYMITVIIFIVAALLLTYTPLPETSISLIAIVTTIFQLYVDIYCKRQNPMDGWGMNSGIVYAIILILFGSAITKNLMITSRTITLLLISIGAGTWRHDWD